MWDSDAYNIYGKERMRPSVDLANSIKNNDFKRIIDIGCGSGMSTAAILSAWKNADIIGVDLSDNMLQAAKKAMPQVEFIKRDCSQPISDMGRFDLIFSNAFMQWISDHKGFIKNSSEMLNEGGVFAAQIPLSDMMPMRKSIREAEKVLPERLKGVVIRKIYTKTPEEYYDIMSEYFDSVDMWITDYFHVMDSREKILDFIKSTALNPYLELLSGEEQEVFLKEVLDSLKREYPKQENGKVLFPFKRLFIVGRK